MKNSFIKCLLTLFSPVLHKGFVILSTNHKTCTNHKARAIMIISNEA